MVCPSCVVGGVAVYSCRYLGLPDVITAMVLGMLSVLFAIQTYRYIKSKKATPKFILVFINVMYGLLTIYTMKYFGMW
jgi:uncharacterized YccA/Bax inhibitor family protein